MAVLGLGVNLALTGLQQLMAPDPSVDTNEQDYLFSGPQTTVASGNPVPILCGEMIIGGILMSSGIIPGTSFTYGHIGGVYTGGGPIARLVGGLDGGSGGTLTGDIAGTITGGGGGGFDAVLESGLDGIEDDIILYSANTYSKPWVAKGPRTGVSYISPVVPHEIPVDSEISHKKAVETAAFRQELLYDEDDVIVGTLPFNALLFKTLEGISLETLVDFGSDTVFATVNRTLDTIAITAEADAAYIAVLSGTFEDSTLSSISSYTAAAELAATLAATFDDATLASAALSDYIATLATTYDSIGISSEATSSILANEVALDATLDTIALATVASSEYIAALAATLDETTLSSVFNPAFTLDSSPTFDTISITAASTFTASGTRTAPVFHTSSVATDTGGSVTVPSGVVSGDLLFAVFMGFDGSNNTRTITVPAGWTSVGAIRRIDGGEKVFAQLAYKVAGGSEPAAYTFTVSGGTYLCGSMLRISSYDGTTPIELSEYQTGTGTTRTAPSATSAYDNSMLVIFSLGIYGVISSTPSGTTERSSWDGGISESFTQALATAGASGSKTHTQSADTPNEWGVISAIINGAP